MKIIRDIAKFHSDGPTAVSLGKFDGLHRGHMLLVRDIVSKRAEGMRPVIFTFDFGDRQGIMTAEERRDILRDAGVECMVECPFVDKFMHTEAEDFVRNILVGAMNARYLAVGTDFRFGYRRGGDYRLLLRLSAECGYDVNVIEKMRLGGEDISSSRVKTALEGGDMRAAAELLGRPYAVTGTVLHGRRIGRTLGMPTINIIPPNNKLLPPNGVYASRTRINGNEYEGITNIGCKPTVESAGRRSAETYIFDFDGDLYGMDLTVSLYCFERPEQKFDSLDDLKRRIEADVIWGRRYFSERTGV